jgi:ion channel-forming bestrophin family protein
MNDVMVGTERILNTPMPIAYTIVFSQITWLYIAVLPFQLVGPLSYISIPASVAAAYIILGILFIGREIENPFGSDVNDLPLDHFCKQIMDDLEIISSRPAAKPWDFITSSRNKVLFPYSESSYVAWANRPDAALKHALKNRPYASFERSTPTANGNPKKTEQSDSSV